jgi:RimJ/RimL family protein N-acetyltransferase
MPIQPPPTVETARLLLRPFAADDVDAVAFYADPDVMRFIPRGAWKRADLPSVFVAMVERRAQQWAARSYGMWAIVFKENGAVIGHCGLQPLEDSGEIEVFYLLDKPYWGRGIAVEAAVASIGFGFEHAGLKRIVAVAMKENAASQRVMQKAGMRFAGPARQYGLDLIKYETSDDSTEKGGD